MEKILYVDDEEINVNAFSMSFEEDFNVVSCRSGEEALRLFKEQDGWAVVVSDQRMPGMTGVELLTEIYRLDPDPIRIILTAYSDSRDIIEAVNKGRIYQYIQKPWDLEILRQSLARAVDVFKLTRDNKLLFDQIKQKNTELFAANEQLQKQIELQAKLEEQRREAEMKLLAQSKLASLGEIATGIAHELNQPMTYIKIITEATRRDLKNNNLDQDELYEELGESQKQIGRVTKIIDHLRVFGRADSLGIEALQLGDVLSNALVLFKRKISHHGINLIITVDEQLSLIQGNSNQLEQVLINLFQNSIDALEGVPDSEITVSIFNKDDSVFLVFHDNGQGMDAYTLERLFEPFFTTKDVGKGTGVGLSIAYGIIKDHNGTIGCESILGQGTTFTITIPSME